MSEQQFFNQTEVAKLAGRAPSSISYHIASGEIPEPTYQVGRRKFYSVQEKDFIVQFFGKWDNQKKGAVK